MVTTQYLVKPEKSGDTKLQGLRRVTLAWQPAAIIVAAEVPSFFGYIRSQHTFLYRLKR
jgi:hypothetical protein